MARKFLTNIDLNSNELQNAKIHLLASDPGSPVDGQIWVNTTTNVLKFRANSVTYTLGRLDQLNVPTAAVNFNGQQATTLLIERLASDPGSPADGRIWVNTTTGVLKYRENSVTYVLGRLDQLNAPTADLNLNSRKITGLADGSAASDAATVGQVTASAAGLDVKQSVRAATTAAGTLATSFANGQTVDGVTLATGNRILIKNQAAGAENGIYTVNASGAPTRATDADISAEVTAGMHVFVEEGTSNADTAWVLTTNDPITLGTTALVFAKFSASPSTVSKFSASVGNGALTSIPVTHNLGTLDVTVEVYTNSDGTKVEPDITHTDTNTVTLAFAVAPTSNQYRCVVIG